MRRVKHKEDINNDFSNNEETNETPVEEADAGKSLMDEATPSCATTEESADQPLEADIAEMQEQLLRLRADFDNYRKRSIRDKTLICDTANQELMKELLPALDHLQMAIQSSEEHNTDPVFLEGLTLIHDQISGALVKFGLAPVDVEGKPFDHNLCEAVNYLPSESYPEGVVTTEVRRGYLLKNRLLRPAQVVVSSGPPEEMHKAFGKKDS